MEELLLNPARVDLNSWNMLLSEVDAVFTDMDNKMFLAKPSKKEVREVVARSNLTAAPGTDGIPSLLYSVCWNTMGEPLTEVAQAIHNLVTRGRSRSSMPTTRWSRDRGQVIQEHRHSLALSCAAHCWE